MKLSLVFELLLIFVLLAFAASKSVRNRNKLKKDAQVASTEDKIEDNSINKYCKCVEAYCNCCRDFSLPVVNLNGPGCASLTYLNGDKMAVSLSFGKKVITNRTLSSKKASPVCMPLPGGISKFCGRVYNIARAGEEFRACLGLELQSKSVVEAAVRVSCFKFGPKGVTSEPADPLPLIPDEKGEDDDDDDDDDDDYGLGGDDADDADDDDDDDDDDEESELEAVNDVDGADYTGFSLLEEDLLGDLFGSSGNKKIKTNKNKNKIKKKQAPAPSTTTTTTTKRPRTTRRPSRRTTTTTVRPTRTTTVRVRPGNRRPTRRPTRRPANGSRPTRRPTSPTSAEQNDVTSASIITSPTPAPPSPTAPPSIANIPVTAKIQTLDKDASSETFEPIIATRTQSTTVKAVTSFDDPGLELSVAHITDQLASMPVMPINNNGAKDSGMVNKPKEEMTFQKVETLTPKAPIITTTTAIPSDDVNDDMIQIVQNLDSVEDSTPEKEEMAVEESRAHFNSHPISGYVLESAFKVPKKKQRQNFDLGDLDVLDLTEIGETIGDELGIFGKKRPIRDSENNIKDTKNDYSEYEDVVDTMGDALLMVRNHSGNKKKKNRGRENKMMRGDWSHV